MIPKGFRDIRTHGSVDREGRLIGVAKNLHGGFHKMRTPAEPSDEWNVHVYKDKKPMIRQLSFSREEVRLYQIAITRDLLEEFNQLLAEGLPVSAHELEQVRQRMKKWQENE